MAEIETVPGSLIRSASTADAVSIAEIYNWYIENTYITFEAAPVSVSEMRKRLQRASRLHPWIVLEQHGKVSGFAYASEFRARAAYRHSVEITIYLDPQVHGNGFGTLLYGRLIEQLRESPAHVLVAVIALPNEQSIGLHEKLGFVKAGHLAELGRKFNKWVDVDYWQLTL